MNEIDVRLRARRFITETNAGEIPTMIAYAKAATARLRYESLSAGESGNTMQHPNGAYIITVNKDESEERQRFTICHEIGHIILKLPSVHDKPTWSAVKRHLNEMACDWFASELLMPHGAFEKRAPRGEPSIAVIETLGRVFGSSFPATASRYASLVAFPCAYVLMDGANVTYASANAVLRSKGIRVACKSPYPAAQSHIACERRNSATAMCNRLRRIFGSRTLIPGMSFGNFRATAASTTRPFRSSGVLRMIYPAARSTASKDALPTMMDWRSSMA